MFNPQFFAVGCTQFAYKRTEFGLLACPALVAVGRERENPRTERSEAAALKVQLVEVARIQVTLW